MLEPPQQTEQVHAGCHTCYLTQQQPLPWKHKGASYKSVKGNAESTTSTKTQRIVLRWTLKKSSGGIKALRSLQI